MQILDYVEFEQVGGMDVISLQLFPDDDDVTTVCARVDMASLAERQQPSVEYTRLVLAAKSLLG